MTRHRGSWGETLLGCAVFVIAVAAAIAVGLTLGAMFAAAMGLMP